MTKTKDEMVKGNLIAGIDEAGRGAIIGPLVIAGVSIDSEKEDKLKKMGVRDSKLLSPKRREFLAERIEEIARDVIVLKIAACRIDKYRREGVNLNKIEVIKMADAINYLKPEKTYIDSPDINTERLRLFLKKMIKEDGARLVVEHKADHKYPVCSAASIIAKVARDEEIEQLKKKYGNMGPGYTSNEITQTWLKEWLEKNRKFPDIVRKTWITASVLDGERRQLKISSWFKKIKGEEGCGK